MSSSDEILIPESVASKMIGDSLTNYRLDLLDKVVCELKELLVRHMDDEPEDVKRILDKMDAAENERRLCEAKLNTRIDEKHLKAVSHIEANHKEAYNNFVQMRHLRIAVSLVIGTIILVGVFQTWNAKQSSEHFHGSANKELILKMEQLTESIIEIKQQRANR